MTLHGQSLAQWNRCHLLFVALHDPHRLAGKCGCRPDQRLYGESRVRAWVLTATDSPPTQLPLPNAPATDIPEPEPAGRPR